MKISLIYAYWPSQPQGVTWCDLPWALRDKGLPKKLHAAGHEVLETVLMAEEPFAEELAAGFKLAGAVAEAVREAVAEGELPVIVAGSCAIAALGAVAGLGAGMGVGTRIAWFDAHADLNTPETSESGLLEGMALSVACGRAWQAISAKQAGLADPARLEDVVLFGVRDTDPAEDSVIAAHAVSRAADAAELGRLFAGAQRVYAHLDIDVHDARGLNTSVFAAPGGPSPEAVREALLALGSIKALSLAGLDPAAPDAARAAEIAIDHVVAVAGSQRP